MKLHHIFTGLACSLVLLACDYESYEEESALGGLQDVAPFVRLLTGEAAGTVEAVVGESDTTFTVEVESQLVTPNDVTVEYALGGTAEYGEIYTIDGADASGGSLTIPFGDLSSTPTFPNEDVVINFLVDTLMSAPQTIVFDLVDATAENGMEVQAGQGPLRRSLTITLVND